MVKLGSKVKDKVTGFEGIAVGSATFMYGCIRIGVESSSLDKDGKPLDAEWFDEQRVEVLEQPPKSVKRPAPSVKLGSYVKDIHTGFEGMAVAWTELLYDIPRVTVEPMELKEGKPKRAEAFVINRIEVIKKQKPKVEPTSTAKSGGPQNDVVLSR